MHRFVAGDSGGGFRFLVGDWSEVVGIMVGAGIVVCAMAEAVSLRFFACSMAVSSLAQPSRSSSRTGVVDYRGLTESHGLLFVGHA